MIYFLVGENTFERSRAVNAIVDSFNGEARVVDTGSLTVRDLSDLFMATSLFEEHRMIILKDMSENAEIWNQLPEWLDKLSDAIDLVFVETKPDRRSKTFKELKAQSEFTEFTNWQDRDESAAADWLMKQAQEIGLALDKKSAREIIERTGMDQYRLASAIEKLLLADQPVSTKVIQEYIDGDLSANVFSLLETALSGDSNGVQRTISILKQSEDAYRVFGLLVSQVFSLTAVAMAKADDDPARDLGIHPYVAKKLASTSSKMSRQRIRDIVMSFFDADTSMKTTSIDPWLLIEATLQKVARVY